MCVDWKRRVVELVLIKQRLADADKEELWEHHLPGVAATSAQLTAVEAKHGKLDASYREFLSVAGGWRGFFQTVDLLGPDDLLGGARWKRAVELLGYLEPGVLHAAGVNRDELLPIAVSSVEIDLFVMTRPMSRQPGVVIWFAGDEIERFSSFDEFLAAMRDYNRREIEQLSEHPH